MASMAKIQVQDQFGAWQNFRTVVNTRTSVKQALKGALQSPIGKRSKKARAIDEKTKAVIDMEFG